MKKHLWLAGWACAFAACAGSEGPQAPSAPAPTPSPAQVVVGATWEAPRAIADAGARPDRCAQQAHPVCYRSYVQTYPVIAANARGQAVAVWQGYEGGGYQLKASRYEPRVGWAEPERILAETGSLEPRVAIDGQGNALAVWWHGGAIHSSYGVPGRAWSAPQALVSGRYPDLAMDEAGRAYLLWSSSQEGLYAMRFTSAGWTAPEAVYAEDPSDRLDIGESHVAIAPNGSVLATWLRVRRADEYGHGRSSEIWLSRTQPGQAWAPPGRIGSIDGAESFALGSVASDTGGAVAFTTVGERDVHRWEVWGQNTVVPTGGTPSWTGPTHLSGPVTPRPPTTLKEFPVLASGGNGNATLVWTEGQDFQGQNDRYVIRARRFSAATSTWDETRAVSDRPGSLASRYGLRAAASPAGNAVAVWTEGASGLLASHFVPGVGWSAPQQLRPGAAAPAVAMDSAGNALVVWSEFGSDRMQIWSARLTAVTGPAP